MAENISYAHAALAALDDDAARAALLRRRATDIVCAYLRKNPVPAAALPKLIETVHVTLSSLPAGTVNPAPLAAAILAAPVIATEPAPVPAAPTAPAASVIPKRTVFPAYIICLEDGKKLKTLKRHLSSGFGLSPEQYREKWGLPEDYPMVAPDYAQKRSALARSLGLGRKAARPAADRVLEITPETTRETARVSPGSAGLWATPDVPPAAPAELNLDQVFARFPRGQAEDITPPPDPALPEGTDTASGPRATRKPFAAQFARTMRK
jgi:predicted transcriptional regulator